MASPPSLTDKPADETIKRYNIPIELLEGSQNLITPGLEKIVLRTLHTQ
jgi:hypothetical protein